jgi:hypothetical protein
MSNFDEVLDWLLDETYPLTRYNALIDLLDRPQHDAEVQDSLSRMLTTSPIQNILRKQQPDGGYETEAIIKSYGQKRNYYGYTPKYKASTWEALFLAQANVPANEHPIQALGNYLLKKVYNKQLGHFLIGPCLNGRMIWVLSKFGFGNNPEVRSTFDFLVKNQRFDDGDFTQSTEEAILSFGRFCWGQASCYAGVSEGLRAMTVVPKALWTPKALEMKRQAIDFMLRHQIVHRQLKPGSKGFVSKSEYRLGERNWLIRFQVPNILPDAIDNIRSLLLLGVKDAALDDIIKQIIGKRNSRNCFVAEHVPSNVFGRCGKEGEETKWLTFRVLRLLKLAGAQDLLG